MNRGLNNAMFSEYITAIERNDLHYPRIDYAYDEHRYVTVDDLFGSGHPPDSVVAGALAWTQRRARIGVIADAIGIGKESRWDLSVG
jgi:hypothetical protein